MRNPATRMVFDVLIQGARIVGELPCLWSSINPRVQKYPYRRILDPAAFYYDFEQPTDAEQCTANWAASTTLALSLRPHASHSTLARTAAGTRTTTHARTAAHNASPAVSESGAAVSTRSGCTYVSGAGAANAYALSARGGTFGTSTSAASGCGSASTAAKSRSAGTSNSSTRSSAGSAAVRCRAAAGESSSS